MMLNKHTLMDNKITCLSLEIQATSMSTNILILLIISRDSSLDDLYTSYNNIHY